jgi:membrane protein DedA with SNARE-associated domain
LDAEIFTQYLTQYGLIAVFIIVFLEYLNLPGFPAGIIMPMAGILAAQGNISLWLTLLLALLAGLCGSWMLYMLGRIGGTAFILWFEKKFPKKIPALNRGIERIRQKGYMGVLVAKLLPTIRTLISIPAGVLKMNFAGYTVYSAIGIFMWNFVLVGAGYFFSDIVLQLIK